jgi:hypothetical protein
MDIAIVENTLLESTRDQQEPIESVLYEELIVTGNESSSKDPSMDAIVADIPLASNQLKSTEPAPPEELIVTSNDTPPISESSNEVASNVATTIAILEPTVQQEPIELIIREELIVTSNDASRKEHIMDTLLESTVNQLKSDRDEELIVTSNHTTESSALSSAIVTELESLEIIPNELIVTNYDSPKEPIELIVTSNDTEPIITLNDSIQVIEPTKISIPETPVTMEVVTNNEVDEPAVEFPNSQITITMETVLLSNESQVILQQDEDPILRVADIVVSMETVNSNDLEDSIVVAEHVQLVVTSNDSPLNDIRDVNMEDDVNLDIEDSPQELIVIGNESYIMCQVSVEQVESPNIPLKADEHILELLVTGNEESIETTLFIEEQPIEAEILSMDVLHSELVVTNVLPLIVVEENAVVVTSKDLLEESCVPEFVVTQIIEPSEVSAEDLTVTSDNIEVTSNDPMVIDFSKDILTSYSQDIIQIPLHTSYLTSEIPPTTEITTTAEPINTLPPLQYATNPEEITPEISPTTTFPLPPTSLHSTILTVEDYTEHPPQASSLDEQPHPILEGTTPEIPPTTHLYTDLPFYEIFVLAFNKSLDLSLFQQKPPPSIHCKVRNTPYPTKKITPHPGNIFSYPKKFPRQILHKFLPTLETFRTKFFSSFSVGPTPQTQTNSYPPQTTSQKITKCHQQIYIKTISLFKSVTT